MVVVVLVDRVVLVADLGVGVVAATVVVLVGGLVVFAAVVAVVVVFAVVSVLLAAVVLVVAVVVVVLAALVVFCDVRTPISCEASFAECFGFGSRSYSLRSTQRFRTIL